MTFRTPLLHLGFDRNSVSYLQKEWGRPTNRQLRWSGSVSAKNATGVAPLRPMAWRWEAFTRGPMAWRTQQSALLIDGAQSGSSQTGWRTSQASTHVKEHNVAIFGLALTTDGVGETLRYCGSRKADPQECVRVLTSWGRASRFSLPRTNCGTRDARCCIGRGGHIYAISLFSVSLSAPFS